jgi:DNA (cytosine-5)-methyltransferase 1
MDIMTHGSLFSGIGGFDLAADWMGWENVFSCEKDDKANKVLEKNFPDVTHYRDIFELDATKYEGKIDIITGGFPCQPFSLAGKRKGRNDERYLWPEMLRIIRECKPSYVVGENVFGLVNMENGSTLERICADLEGEGFTVESFIIPACAVQAWHRRDRIWIIAYSNNRNERRTPRRFQGKDGQGRLQEREQMVQPGSAGEAWFSTNTDNTRNRTFRSKGKQERQKIEQGRKDKSQSKFGGHSKDVANANGIRPQESRESRGSMHKKSSQKEKVHRAFNDSIWEVKPRLGRMVNGLSSWMDEPEISRVTNKSKGRADRLKQLGNAIVPQVAYEIFKIIEMFDLEIGKL